MKIMVLLIVVVFSALNCYADCTLTMTVNDPISASTVDYFQRANARAEEKKCSSIFIRVNTPGGSLQSTRLIVETILASSKPYLCLISPRGGHAGSAGAIILQACHVNGGLPTTSIGAATPILGTGEKIPDDLRKKIVNDTVSWLAGITALRGRNSAFSKEIITEAKSVSSEEAVQLKALDILANDEADFLKKAEARSVLVGANKETVLTKIAEVDEFMPDLRYKILNFIADPEFSYLLFMGSLALLYVEITNPGLIAPGVIGGIGLLFSLVAFHKLNVMWGGLALILLGILFLVLEIFVTSFGILGFGGLISIFVGSVFLFDAQTTGYSLPLPLIFSVVGTLGVFFLGLGYLALRTIRFKSRDLDSDLKEAVGVVIGVEPQGHSGQMEILGETWNFVSEDSLLLSEKVKVISREGLTLKVKKLI